MAYILSFDGGIIQQALPNDKVDEAAITKPQIEEVANLVDALEHSFQQPQECEWAYENNLLYCLQTRPITHLPPTGFYSAKINGTKATLWDDSQTFDSYSGVTTPLTFTFVNHIHRQVYRQFFKLMNVPEAIITSHESTFHNMLGFIRGRIYHNLINRHKLVNLLPFAANNAEFMKTMIGVKEEFQPELKTLLDFAAETPRYSFFHKARLLCTTVIRFWKIDHTVNEFQQHFEATYKKTSKVDFSQLSLPEQVQYCRHLEDKLLKRWQAPIINDCIRIIFLGLLRKFTNKWIAIGDSGVSLQNDLLCGQGDTDSIAPTKILMCIAENINNGDPQFREWFLSTPPHEIWEKLSHDEHPHVIFLMLKKFLDEYGFRCVNELKLEETDFHNDPSFAISIIVNYINNMSYSIQAMEQRKKYLISRAEGIVNQRIKGLKRTFYYWILKNARHTIKYREQMRFAQTRTFGIVRHLFLAIGKNLVLMKILDDKNDVFYLTIDEILSFVEGRSNTAKFREIVKFRRYEFDNYRNTDAPPHCFFTHGTASISFPYPQVLADGNLLKEDKANQDPHILMGTPCCPGIVEGTVRVANNVADTVDLKGEILAIEKTDPGWIPLLPCCSGLLIERGNLLSHSAVIARELDIPTIVDISGGLMEKLKSGQKIHVDAGKGLIHIIA